MQVLWFVPGAIVLTMLTKVPVGKAMLAEGGGYDNRHPRAQQARLTGIGARALAAHQNSFEALPIFLGGLLTGAMLQGDSDLLCLVSSAWVLLRLVYVWLYIKDIAMARSVVWFLALGCSLATAVIGLCH